MEGSLKKLKVHDRDEVVYKRPRREKRSVGHPCGEARPVRFPQRLGGEKRSLLRRIENLGRILAVDHETFTLLLAFAPALPKLPGGYYFKGGAAREALRRALRPDSRPFHLRDFDLVRFSGSDDRRDHELALRYMGADYEFGHGVEVAESKEIYFRTRDLTVNEVLCSGAEVQATFAALEHMLRGELRPTAYIQTTAAHMQARTLMKAVRLAAEGLVLDIPLELVDFTGEIDAAPFDVALHLNRAFAAGTVVAEEYVFSVWKLGFLMPEREAPPPLTDAVAFLAARLARGASFFTHMPEQYGRQPRPHTRLAGGAALSRSRARR